jgi:hypothetical protein
VVDGREWNKFGTFWQQEIGEMLNLFFVMDEMNEAAEVTSREFTCIQRVRRP